jgi:hypothetical protein
LFVFLPLSVRYQLLQPASQTVLPRRSWTSWLNSCCTSGRTNDTGIGGLRVWDADASRLPPPILSTASGLTIEFVHLTGSANRRYEADASAVFVHIATAVLTSEAYTTEMNAPAEETPAVGPVASSENECA